MSDNADALAAVLGRVPSGIFIVTACDGSGRTTGFLASWVQQAGFEPPTLTVVVNKKRYLNDWFSACPKMGINIVAEGQKHFLKHFGAGFPAEADAFTGLDIETGQTGVPLLCGALGWLEGDVTGKLETGDHVIYAVQITNAKSGLDFLDQKPMVHIRKNGLNY